MPHGSVALEAGGTNAIGRMLGLLGDEWNLLIVQQSRVLTGAEILVHRDGEYLPTARGRSLWPLLMLIWDWERTWVPDHAGLLPAMGHNSCGHSFSPILRCTSCQRPATPKNVDLTQRPFFGVLLIAIQWAHRWFATPDGPAVVARHTDCGQPLTAELACAQCDRRLIGTEVTVSPETGSGSP